MKVCWMVWILAASLRCLWQSVAVKVMKVAFTAYSAGAITNGESAPILCSDFVIRSTAAARCRRRQQHNPASTLTSASEQVKGASEGPTPRNGRPDRTEGICRLWQTDVGNRSPLNRAGSWIAKTIALNCFLFDHFVILLMYTIYGVKQHWKYLILVFEFIVWFNVLCGRLEMSTILKKFKKSYQTKYVEFSRTMSTIAFSIGENKMSYVHFILRITIC